MVSPTLAAGFDAYESVLSFASTIATESRYTVDCVAISSEESSAASSRPGSVKVTCCAIAFASASSAGASSATGSSALDASPVEASWLPASSALSAGSTESASAASSPAKAARGVMETASTTAMNAASMRCHKVVLKDSLARTGDALTSATGRAFPCAFKRMKLGPSFIGTSLPGLSAMDECSDFASLERPARPRFCSPVAHYSRPENTPNITAATACPKLFRSRNCARPARPSAYTVPGRAQDFHPHSLKRARSSLTPASCPTQPSLPITPGFYHDSYTHAQKHPRIWHSSADHRLTVLLRSTTADVRLDQTACLKHAIQFARPSISRP